MVAPAEVGVGPAERVEQQIRSFGSVVSDQGERVVDDAVLEQADEGLVEAPPAGAGAVEDHGGSAQQRQVGVDDVEEGFNCQGKPAAGVAGPIDPVHT